MVKIKIFLASSLELRYERMEIADLIGHMNLALEHEDVKIYLVKWEYLDASMGEGHKQEEYNKKLERCELCLVLFAKSLGQYTESELKTAYQKFCNDGEESKRLFVFFKDTESMAKELKEFKSTFDETYPGITSERFGSITDLKKEFLKLWDGYQKDALDDHYPVVFAENTATLNGKKLLIF